MSRFLTVSIAILIAFASSSPLTSAALNESPDTSFLPPSESELTLVPTYLDSAPSPTPVPPDNPDAPHATDSEESLAKATQNPVADLISVPFQNNFNFGVGPNNSLQYILNFQPVIPFHLTDDWNLITRTIIPFINQESPAPGVSSDYGLSDTQFTAFLSPAKPGKWIWGVGPIFQFPTATDTELGSGKYAAGPSAVLLRMDGHWVYGALINQLWSFAGDSDRPSVNQMLIQPFVNFNLPHGFYLVSSPIITANWQADSDDTWTVPVGGGVGKIFKVGPLPLNFQVQAFANVVRPDNGPDWQLRAQLQFLFPR